MGYFGTLPKQKQTLSDQTELRSAIAKSYHLTFSRVPATSHKKGKHRSSNHPAAEVLKANVLQTDPSQARLLLRQQAIIFTLGGLMLGV